MPQAASARKQDVTRSDRLETNSLLGKRSARGKFEKPTPEATKPINQRHSYAGEQHVKKAPTMEDLPEATPQKSEDEKPTGMASRDGKSDNMAGDNDEPEQKENE